ncbi:hypothetical protein Hanom_Chr10g00958581 [Helianthus anomalus]
MAVHGSRAAKEKQYFDSHLAPFYRIEQLLLATKPQGAHMKPPSIVTDENIKLLFEIQEKYFKMDPKNFDDFGWDFGISCKNQQLQHFV